MPIDIRQAPSWGRKPHRPPLRTLSECAEELGVSAHALGKALKQPGAPAPVLNNSNNGSAFRVLWFNPRQVRDYWKGLVK